MHITKVYMPGNKSWDAFLWLINSNLKKKIQKYHFLNLKTRNIVLESIFWWNNRYSSVDAVKLTQSAWLLNISFWFVRSYYSVLKLLMMTSIMQISFETATITSYREWWKGASVDEVSYWLGVHDGVGKRLHGFSIYVQYLYCENYEPFKTVMMDNVGR